MSVLWSSDGLWLYQANLDHEVDLGVLSDTERSHADSIANAFVRKGFLARRSLLRRLVGEHLGIPPESLPIQIAPLGKPFLAGMGLEFSVSSSHEKAVVLISEAGPVGADIERIDHDLDFEGILREHFANAEIDRRAKDRTGAFFRGWVLKEACAKVDGNGIGTSLRCYEVDSEGVGWQSVTQGLRAQIVACDDAYAIAVAVRLAPQANF